LTEPLPAALTPNKLCFIVGPIGKEGSDARKRSDLLLRLIIQPVMKLFPEFRVERADQIAKPGMIDRQIITRLRDADLVIADLATSNPNAFYEIGIRHMVEKPIVHMQQDSEQIPFDVSLYSAVIYSMDSVQALDRAIEDLGRHVAAALDVDHEIDNPVTRALGQVQFNQSALPEIALLRGEIESLRALVEPFFDKRRREAVSAITRALSDSEAGPTNALAAYTKNMKGDRSELGDLLANQLQSKKDT
jgi:signal transduction histidine kinase